MKITNPFRARVAQAVAQVEVERARPQLDDVPLDDFARAQEIARLSTISERTRRLQAAQRVADREAGRADALDASATEHEATERLEADRIAATGRALAASRDKLAAAVKTADRALVAAFEAAQAHDALVVERSAELLAAGLADQYVDGDGVVVFDTGGTPAHGLRVAGRTWTRVDPAAVLYRSLYGAIRARLGDRAAGPLKYNPAVMRVERQTAGLLDGAPLPEPFHPEVPQWRHDLAAAQQAGRPALARRPAPDTLEAQREAHAANVARSASRAGYVKVRAELVKARGEAHVADLEAQLFVDGRPFADA